MLIASSQASKINKRRVRNKIARWEKIPKLNKRTCTTIPHFRVQSFVLQEEDVTILWTSGLGNDKGGQ